MSVTGNPDCNFNIYNHVHAMQTIQIEISGSKHGPTMC